MLSLKFIKENFDLVKKSTISKNIDFDFEELLKNDESRIELIQKVESFIWAYFHTETHFWHRLELKSLY